MPGGGLDLPCSLKLFRRGRSPLPEFSPQNVIPEGKSFSLLPFEAWGFVSHIPLFNYYKPKHRFSSKCREGDSNPHAVKHTPLKRTCLPIPPSRLMSLLYYNIFTAKVKFSANSCKFSHPAYITHPFADAYGFPCVKQVKDM